MSEFKSDSMCGRVEELWREQQSNLSVRVGLLMVKYSIQLLRWFLNFCPVECTVTGSGMGQKQCTHSACPVSVCVCVWQRLIKCSILIIHRHKLRWRGCNFLSQCSFEANTLNPSQRLYQVCGGKSPLMFRGPLFHSQARPVAAGLLPCLNSWTQSLRPYFSSVRVVLFRRPHNVSGLSWR